jgi:hypothetical protein
MTQLLRRAESRYSCNQVENDLGNINTKRLPRCSVAARWGVEAMMRTIILALSAWLMAAGTPFAQAFPPNEAGVTMGHWHLNSRDVEANKKILVAMAAPQSSRAISRS